MDTTENYDDRVMEELEDLDSSEASEAAYEQREQEEATLMMQERDQLSEMTPDEILMKAVHSVLEEKRDKKLSPIKLSRAVLKEQQRMLDMYNNMQKKASANGETGRVTVRIPEKLEPPTVAEMILHTQHIINVTTDISSDTEEDKDILVFYSEERGVYRRSRKAMERIITSFQNLSKMEIEEVLSKLKRDAPRAEECENPNLVPVNNGIFNTETQELMPFSPDYVFLAKCAVDYNAMAQPARIKQPDGTIWDVDSWFMDMMDGDPEMANVLWEVTSAVLRPYVPWNKNVYFFSKKGNNGKGTLVELYRNLTGSDWYVIRSMEQLETKFGLDGTQGKHLIIGEENEVDAFMEKATNQKLIATGDAMSVEVKYQSPFNYKFHGLMIQCVNSLPKTKDKTGSIERRRYVVDFPKSYTGRENKAIKEDYIKRREVLEYILKKALEMKHTELSEPEKVTLMNAEISVSNNPVMEFWLEISPKFVWDLEPFGFLYDLYSEWYKRSYPGGKCISKKTFTDELEEILQDDDEWDCPPRRRVGKDGRAQYPTITTGTKMALPEYLIKEYNLVRWYRRNYSGSNEDIKCSPSLAANYRGIERRQPRIPTTPQPEYNLPQTPPPPPTPLTPQTPPPTPPIPPTQPTPPKPPTPPTEG